MNDSVWSVVKSWNFWSKKIPPSVHREITDEVLRFVDIPEATYLYGPRRVGKTTVCFQLIQHLSKKYGKTSCLYVNFEEPSFSGMLNTDFLSWLMDRHTTEFGKPPQYVFLDEIQNVSQWEKFVRVVVDQKKFKIIVTGSSAKLLSSEFSASLGGRGLGFMVLPFSFREFKKTKKKATLKEYAETGGYPAIVLEKDSEKRTRLLEEYYDTTITRDISARHDIRDLPSLRTLAVFVLTNSGKKFSYNSIRQTTGLSFDAIKQYLSYLEDAFLVFSVPFFSYSLKKSMEKPRKYYAYDTGMQTAISKSFSSDTGRKIENIVAIELLRRKKEIQYYADKKEVDFIIKDGTNVTALNVCITQNAPPREKEALEEFAHQFKQANTILLNGEKNIEEWLLEKK